MTRSVRRGRRLVVLALLAATAVVAGLPLGPTPVAAQGPSAAPPDTAAPAADPRPVPPAMKVTITPTGFEPRDVAVVAGQALEFTNASGVEQTVDDPGSLFDSGPVPNGGGFTVTIGGPTYTDYTSATAPVGDPPWIGSIIVGQLDLPGPPGGPVNQHLVEVPVPPATDLDEIPDLGIGASRTRVVVRFHDTTTVAQANAALAAADVKVVGVTPRVKMVVVAVDDPGVGNLDPVQAAADALRADPAVKAAGLDLERVLHVAPPTAEEARVQGLETFPGNWTWTDARFPDNGSGQGSGGNYGIESARFPQAWNLLDDVRKKDHVVDTVVFDAGFFPEHIDLRDRLTVKPLCNAAGRCSRDTVATPTHSHGAHVAGTIGASFANPVESQPGRVLGVDGANPVAYLYGTPIGSFTGNIIPRNPSPVEVDRPGWFSSSINEDYGYLIEGKAKGLWPNLRVVNVSYGSFGYRTDPDGRAKWGRLIGSRRCGPGSGDDRTAAATGPCTPQTEDRVRRATETMAEFAKDLAFLAQQDGVTLVWSAGNESDDICVKPDNGVAQPPCTAGQSPATLDSRLVLDAAMASAAIGDNEFNPFIIVESVDSARARSAFSNVGGDVSAGGDRVLSTVADHEYRVYSGTSMSAPHVTALVGYLLATRPDLTTVQIRRLLKEFGWADVTGDGAPRIDAFTTVLAADASAAKALVDVNDLSADGNRRIAYGREGGPADTVDQSFGPTVRNVALRSDPDGRIDMRDFRRYRDAFLAACASAPSGEVPSSAVCPQPSAVRLDGAADHPKKDANQDGCVAGQTPVCTQPEHRFSRFDFNGDGSLDLAHQAPLPLVREATGGTRPAAGRGLGQQFTDLELLQAWWEADPGRTEGYRAADLGHLLASGDLEVRADALFQAGATAVDVLVDPGPGATVRPAPQRISPGGSVVVTAPADGSTVKVTGVGLDKEGKAIAAYPEERELFPGQDHRVDLCTPTVSAVPGTTQPTTDAGTVAVAVAVKNCGRPVTEPVELTHVVAAREGEPAPSSTVSAPASTTDATGRGSFHVVIAPRAEVFDLVVEARIDLDPDSPGPEEVAGTVAMEVSEGPRLVYRWEQVTDDWHLDESGQFVDENLQTVDFERDWDPLDEDEDLVLERKGTVTPVPAGPGGRSDARIVEEVGANGIDFRTHRVSSTGGTLDGTGTLAIPESERRRDYLSSQAVVDRFEDDGLERGEHTFGNTWFDVHDDQVVVHNLDDIGGAGYRYSASDQCDVFCDVLWYQDQLGLAERERGSSLAWADDLDQVLTFHREESGGFGSYAWCSEPEDYEMRRVVVGPHRSTGTARSRFRFVATLTTDPDLTPDDLSFPDDCTTPAPPRAAIARDWVTAHEGDLVKFIDASTDPNGDIVSRTWDFGDGTTSTEQFPRHRFDDDGDFLVRLTVRDRLGRESTASLQVFLANADPEVSADPVRVEEGEPVLVPVRLFDPGERDQEALRLEVRWEGGTVYPSTVTRGGATTLDLGPQPAGARRLSLRVLDKNNGEDSTTVDVVVGGPPEAPGERPPEVETTPAPGCVYGVRTDVDELVLLEAVTGYRTANGRRPLYASPTLTEAALAHARWLRDEDLFQHEGEDDRDPLARALDAGYPGAVVAENLARGPADPLGALVAWKISDAHDAAQLDPRWRAVGMAAVDTVHGRLWVVLFGDHLDCPTEAPDFGGEVDPVVEPTGPPVPVVLPAGARSELDAAAGSPAPAPAAAPGPQPGPLRLVAPSPAPAPQADPSPAAPATTPSADVTANDVTAFATTVVAPETGAPVTFTNRGQRSLQLDPGDGRPGVPLDVGRSTTLTYLDPGTVTVRGTSTVGTATQDLAVGGSPLPPVVTYGGPTATAQGARPTLRAAVRTAAGVAVVGRVVEFSLEGRTVSATTDVAGDAAVPWTVDVAAGSHTLRVAVLPTASGPGAAVDVALTVAANTAPVAEANGPYDVELGAALTLDDTGSFDPDGLALTGRAWDLDDDGQFETGAGAVVPAEQVAALVCGGNCTPGVDETVRLRVTDAAGGEATDAATVRLRRDFTVGVGPPSGLINPGGNIGFEVTVDSTSGFDQPVALTAPTLPPGVTATFSPATVVPGGRALLSIAAAPGAPASDGDLVVRGTSGTLVHEARTRVEVEFGLVPVCTVDADVRVIDAATGLPVVGAVVNQNFATPTDGDGRVRLTGLGLGQNNAPINRTFLATAAGYDSASTSVLTACGVDADVVVRMNRPVFGTFAGRVVEGVPDPNDHTPDRQILPTDVPIDGASVGIGTSSSMSSMRFTGTATDGTFSIPDHRTGLFFTRFEKPGYTAHGGTVVVPANGTVEVVQPLVRQCTGEVDVRVRDGRTGLPMEGVSVVVVGSTATTGPGGRARLTGVPLGDRNSTATHNVSARAEFGDLVVSAVGPATLTDCGSIGVVDLALTPPEARTVVLEGRVTNRDTGAPVAGAGVYPMDYGGVVFTDADGRYRTPEFIWGYDGDASKTTTVAFEAPFAERHLYVENRTVVPVTYVDGDTVTVDGTLEPQRYSSVDIQVVDAETGDPVPGALVGPTFEHRTDAEGRRRVEGIRTNVPVPYGEQAFAPGFVQASAQTTLVPGGNVTLVIRLARQCAPASIGGLVRNAATGEPLPDAFITLLSGSSPDGSQFRTGPDGRFLLPRVVVANRLPTSVTLLASKVGFNSVQRTVQVYCGARLTVDMNPPNTGTGSLGGVVTRADTGAAVSGAVVTGEWGQLATTGPDGRYAFPSVPLEGATGSRTWNVFVSPPAGTPLASVERTATVNPEQASTLDVELPARAPNGRPVADPQELTMPDGQTQLDLDLTGSDPEGQPLTFRLVTDGQTGFTLSHTYPASRARVFMSPGVAEGRFSFVVSDGLADSVPAQVVVRRGSPPANTPPSAAIAAFADLNEGGTRSFDGTGSSDPGGSVVGYAWDLDGDGQFDDSSSATPSFTYPQDGTVIVGLEVTDDRGATGTTTRVLTVHNVLPTVSVGADVTLDAAGVLSRAGSFTDPGADVWSATVDWSDGTGEQPLSLSGQTFSLDRTFPAGTRTVTVEVCDDDGCSTDALVVTVPEPPPTNEPPVASVTGPASVAEGSLAALDASGSSDPDGTVVAWHWDLDGDGAFDDAAGATVDVPTTDDGTVTAVVRVRDDDGATSTATHVVAVTNAVPVVDAGGDGSVELGSEFVRAGSSSDPGADSWTATVDWGEGAGPAPLALAGQAFDLAHTFAAAGPFTVTVRVCDDDEGCGTDVFRVVVSDPPPLPEADLSVVKSHDGDLVAGGTVDYDLAVVNAGPDPATGVVVTDTLPAGLSFVSGVGSGWSCAATGPVVTCTRSESLAVGPAPGLTVRAALASSLSAGSTVTNTAAVASDVDDPDPTDDVDEDAGVVVAVSSADLSVALTGPTTVTEGEEATWTVTVTNAGPDDAGAVSLSVVVPPALADVEMVGDGWDCTGAAPVVCTRPTLAAGASASVTVTGTATAAAPDGAAPAAAATLEVSVTGAASDPDGADNAASHTFTIEPNTTSSSSTSTTSSSTSSTSGTRPSSTSSSVRPSTTGSTARRPTTSSATAGAFAAPGFTTPSTTRATDGATGASASGSSGSSGSSGASGTASGSLPATGSSPWILLVLGLALLAAGATLLRLRHAHASRP